VVYDVRGREVATLFRGALDAGPHRFSWNGNTGGGDSVGGGVYFVSVRSEGLAATQRVVVFR
jgi:flagellar hook assembly protein FlgD